MDRSLATLLRSLQASSNYEEAASLLPSATGVLARLSNPLNVSLLSSKLLSDDVLYAPPTDLAQCRRIFTVFYTAALRFAENELIPEQESTRSNLSRHTWLKAVIQGADDRSPRWRHTLLIGGLLLGMDGRNQRNLPSDLRKKLEAALVVAANLALRQDDTIERGSQFCLAFVLNHVFPLLSDHHRAQLNYDLLLPVLVDATWCSDEGLQHGRWLSTIDADVRQVGSTKFNWSSRSPSFAHVQQLRSKVLVSSLAPLARLIAHAIDHASDVTLVMGAVDRLVEFARTTALLWRQNKLSEVEQSEEATFLDRETLTKTLPVLLDLLRDTLFAMIICLRTAIGRLLCDPVLATDTRGPHLAMQCLRVLRDTFFISHRFGQNSYSQYQFVNYTAIDILNQYPSYAEAFLASIRPADLGRIPAHPLERLNDLFFLNIAEHFTLTLEPRLNEELLVNAATPYIVPNGDRRLGEIYEAAHSVILAVFAAPQNSEIAARHMPFYIETLLQSFPQTLSPRQFRLAIKSVVRIGAPPSLISRNSPLMQSTILELLNERIASATETLLPPEPSHVPEAGPLSSEKSVLILAMMDSLCFLPLSQLADWLSLCSELLHTISDSSQRRICQQRLWEVLSDGSMDVDRASACVSWWNNQGGREIVLYGEQPEDNDYVMSGAISQGSRL